MVSLEKASLPDELKISLSFLHEKKQKLMMNSNEAQNFDIIISINLALMFY